MEIPAPATTLNASLLEQLTFHWDVHLRPKLDGLTDEEYFWEPVANVWNLVPKGSARTPVAGGTGEYVAEFAMPEPDPAPVTTIAWRLAHLIVGVFGERNHSHFGGPLMSYMDMAYPGTAKEALVLLDDVYARWCAGVAALGEEGLQRPVGPAEGPFAEHPYSTLVLHIHREAIHHGAEILLLRDLWRNR